MRSVPSKTKLPGPWKKPTPPKVLEPAENRVPHAFATEADELEVADVAALVVPVNGEALAGDADAVLDRAVNDGTVVMLNWDGVQPEDATKLMQFACDKLGLRVPGKSPTRMPRTAGAAISRLDEWLEPLGVRLLQIDIDADDVFVLPMLADDDTVAAGRSVNCARLIVTRG